MRGKIIKLSIAAAVIGIGSLLISYFGGPSRATIDNTPDCDNVAIFYCGSMSESEFHRKWNNDGRYKDHATVFAAFGINKADVTGMVDGIVWKDGRVTLADGTVVATGAITAGRNYGGTPIPGTQNAAKYSTSKFVTRGQTAMIKMVNGQFKFAVVKSCGNPVSATPVVKPEAACLALANPVITDRTRVSLTSTASVKNGATISSHIFTIHNSSGAQINQHIINTTATTAKTDFIVAQPGTYTAKVAIRTSVGDVRSANCEKKFTIQPEAPSPIASCKLLHAPVITNRSNVSLKADASVANGAKVSGYVFTVYDSANRQISSKTVNTTATSASTDMTVNAAGEYTAKVVVKTSLGDKTAAACEQKFTIKEADKPGVKIEKTVNGVKHDVVGIDEPFTYEIAITNTGNVKLDNVVIEDKAPEGVTFRSASSGNIENNVWTHTIQTLEKGVESKFTITAVVSKYFEDDRKNTACVDTPSIPGEPDDCDDATIKVEYETMEVCRLEDKKYPVTIKKHEFDSKLHSTDPADCKDQPEEPKEPKEPKQPDTPTELPRTGGEMDGLLNALGVGALTTSLLAYIASRRQSLL